MAKLTLVSTTCSSLCYVSNIKSDLSSLIADRLCSKLAPRRTSRLPIPNFSPTFPPTPLRELSVTPLYRLNPVGAEQQPCANGLPEPSPLLPTPFSTSSPSSQLVPQRACTPECESASEVALQRIDRKGKKQAFGPEDFSDRWNLVTDKYACTDATSDLVSLFNQNVYQALNFCACARRRLSQHFKSPANSQHSSINFRRTNTPPLPLRVTQNLSLFWQNL